MQPTSLRVYFNFQSNKKFFRDYFSTCLVSGGPPTRGRFVSRSFSDLLRLRYLSRYQRHPFRYISLMEFPYRSPFSSSSLNLSPVLIVSLQILCTFYTTYLPLSATVTFTHVVIFPSSRTAILICSAEFSGKMTVLSPDT